MLQPKQSIDHLFRHEYSKIVAVLTTRYGAKAIDQVEDAVQDALLRAMQVWGFQQLPDNPSAWLYRVASNRLVDLLRRDNRLEDISNLPEAGTMPVSLSNDISENGVSDELLQMIFACCQPSLSEAEQLALSLKLLCGLSIKEIAQALLKKEETIKKSVTRAKGKLAQIEDVLSIPVGIKLRGRLQTVLKVIYLLFNEGYKATAGDKLIKKDICEEAIRLAGILHQNKHCCTPALNALLALMCFNAARFDARVSTTNELLTLAEQNRELWDSDYIEWGIHFLKNSSDGLKLSRYQLEAGIAGFYVTAPCFEETNWQAILMLYDLLLRANPSPMVRLNRIVVLQKVKGNSIARRELDEISESTELQNNYLFYSIKADLAIAAEDLQMGVASLEKAIQLTENDIERKFLESKLADVRSKAGLI